MATTDNPRDEKSYLLLVQPVEYSLREGTDIPSPPETPEQFPIEPPTAGGGPLTSHPATDSIPGAYPSSDSEKENINHTPEGKKPERVDSFNSPGTPDTSSSPQMERRPPTGIRRLMSLSNLRSSISSSRTSLSLPRTSITDRPGTGVKRPSSPSFVSSSAPSSAGSRPPLRSKKSSGNWFKRKSSMFLMNHDGTLNAVAEDQGDSHDSRRFKESAPKLPEISFLGGGNLAGGDLGWDSTAFWREI